MTPAGAKDLVYANVVLVNGTIILYFKAKEAKKQEWIEWPKSLIQYGSPGDGNVDFLMWTIFESTRQKVSLMIMPFLKKNSKIRIVGHGVGGVYGVFMALEIQKQTQVQKDIAVFTFGSPRMGDRLFAKYVNRQIKKVYRITYHDDYVPQFPTTVDMKGYWHHDTEYWIAPQCECDSIELFECHGNWVGNQQYGYSNESKDCNQLIPNLFGDKELTHYGPYFGLMMSM
ncbi:hypothetical protein G9A89_017280 [Geosiphon pyriformis]|nr:hypothetical protein G9A89_017280 [Geosiphon pyriformis]